MSGASTPTALSRKSGLTETTAITDGSRNRPTICKADKKYKRVGQDRRASSRQDAREKFPSQYGSYVNWRASRRAPEDLRQEFPGGRRIQDETLLRGAPDSSMIRHGETHRSRCVVTATFRTSPSARCGERRRALGAGLHGSKIGQ